MGKNVALKKSDYMFSIGYEGQALLVDGNSRKKYTHYTLQQLLENSLLKAAVCWVAFTQDQQEEAEVLACYNKSSRKQCVDIGELKQLYGVQQPPANINKIIVV